jgi:hypothetical protein
MLSESFRLIHTNFCILIGMKEGAVDIRPFAVEDELGNK